MATDPADHAVHPLCCCSQPSYLCDYEITGTVFVQVSTEMINFYDSVYDKGITQSVTTDKGKEQAAATVLKVFHETVLIFFFFKYRTTVSLNIVLQCVLHDRNVVDVL